MEWYYQIKVRNEDPNNLNNWDWPPIICGKIEAGDKAKARRLLLSEYDIPLEATPTRDQQRNASFLIHIVPLDNLRLKGLFENITCKQCKKTFRIIDKYNDAFENYKGPDFCSSICRNESDLVQKLQWNGGNDSGFYPPLIYLIRNHKEEKNYVGKTTQAFTLRWYQHFFQGTKTKFHNAIKESELTDWTFKILEVVKIPPHFKMHDQIEKYILVREMYWVRELKAHTHGYNTVLMKNLDQELTLIPIT